MLPTPLTSNLFGYQAGKTFTSNNIGTNNIIIGTNISLPDATANSMNIGGVLFGTGFYSTATGDPSVSPISGGSIGIGIVSPNAKLHVYDPDAGSNTAIIRFQGSTVNCYLAAATSKQITCTSDMTLKKNIVNINTGDPFILNINPVVVSTSSLDKLIDLQVVSYNWKTESDDAEKSIGFIAQDMERMFPDLVDTDSNTGLKSVSHIGLIPYTISAIQELNTKFINNNIFASVGSSSLINNAIKASLNDLSLTLASSTTFEESDTLLTNLSSLFSTSSLASIKALTSALTQNDYSLNFNNNALVNIKSLQGSGGWRITEDGTIEATKLCLKNSAGNYVCIDGDVLESLGIGNPVNNTNPIVGEESNTVISDTDISASTTNDTVSDPGMVSSSTDTTNIVETNTDIPTKSGIDILQDIINSQTVPNNTEDTSVTEDLPTLEPESTPIETAATVDIIETIIP